MFAQNLTVTGVVTEKATGYPAIGVSVLVKGTTNGTITDMDGNFSVEASDNDILQVAYICLMPQDIAVKGKSELTVTIREDTQ